MIWTDVFDAITFRVPMKVLPSVNILLSLFLFFLLPIVCYRRNRAVEKYRTSTLVDCLVDY